MSEKFDLEKVDLNDGKYAKEYNEERLWGKIKNVAKKAGIKVIYYVLLLFYGREGAHCCGVGLFHPAARFDS